MQFLLLNITKIVSFVENIKLIFLKQILYQNIKNEQEHHKKIRGLF